MVFKHILNFLLVVFQVVNERLKDEMSALYIISLCVANNVFTIVGYIKKFGFHSTYIFPSTPIVFAVSFPILGLLYFLFLRRNRIRDAFLLENSNTLSLRSKIKVRIYFIITVVSFALLGVISRY